MQGDFRFWGFYTKMRLEMSVTSYLFSVIILLTIPNIWNVCACDLRENCLNIIIGLFARLFLHSEAPKDCFTHSSNVCKKHREIAKGWVHFINCWGVKLFLPKELLSFANFFSSHYFSNGKICKVNNLLSLTKFIIKFFFLFLFFVIINLFSIF